MEISDAERRLKSNEEVYKRKILENNSMLINKEG